jgi:hypothetical protein
MLKRVNDHAYLASLLAPSPERLERNQALRATLAGLALVGLLALLAVGLLSLVGCSKPSKYEYICFKVLSINAEMPQPFEERTILLIEAKESLSNVQPVNDNFPQAHGEWTCERMEFSR